MRVGSKLPLSSFLASFHWRPLYGNFHFLARFVAFFAVGAALLCVCVLAYNYQQQQQVVLSNKSLNLTNYESNQGDGGHKARSSLLTGAPFYCQFFAWNSWLLQLATNDFCLSVSRQLASRG